MDARKDKNPISLCVDVLVKDKLNEEVKSIVYYYDGGVEKSEEFTDAFRHKD